VLSNGMQDVFGDDLWAPEKALILGPCRVIAQEYPHLTCQSIDIAGHLDQQLSERLIAEAYSGADDAVIAYSGARRWTQSFTPLRLPELKKRPAKLREGGVYLQESTNETKIPFVLDAQTDAASRAKGGREAIVKVVNVSRAAQETEIKLNGAELGSSAEAIVLTSEKPEDENSLEQPTRVSPVEHKLACSGSVLQHTFPPNSVTILRLPLK